VYADVEAGHTSEVSGGEQLEMCCVRLGSAQKLPWRLRTVGALNWQLVGPWRATQESGGDVS
jgi:hypothetical protein